MTPSDVQFAVAILGAAPGLLALAGAGVGYGRLVQRLITVERDLADVKDLSDRVSRIDERTKSTNQQVTEVKESVDKLVSHLLNEPRSFNEPRKPPTRR